MTIFYRIHRPDPLQAQTYEQSTFTVVLAKPMARLTCHQELIVLTRKLERNSEIQSHEYPKARVVTKGCKNQQNKLPTSIQGPLPIPLSSLLLLHYSSAAFNQAIRTMQAQTTQ
ncbi:hypothetical protein Tcan_14576 [Toxocara canis]|uniref:Uncharacterized protein n=1 Tax=Toxocara canis TaxID=6265 RepID=A0A0B2VWD3_TOXCA|nr:hypothetical protein Tcan_14576 [Toxocara canis]